MDEITMSQAAEEVHLTRQAIFIAIKKGKLKAKKVMLKFPKKGKRLTWVLTREDLDEYRRNRYLTETRKVDGEPLYDIEQSRWSVLHASKALSSWLKYPYPPHHIYYMLRRGVIRGSRKGRSWVLSSETVQDLYEQAVRSTPNFQESQA